VADLLALGVVVSTTSCNGPMIDYKGGRIDALAGGVFGVPDPDITAQDYFERMALLGLSEKESIQFLACGHTIGSVHHSGFPEVQDASYVTPQNTNGGCPFDATVAGFDNSVVNQYLDDTTQNPLVRSFNETNRSDLRIYSADGNVTMKE
jgi:catalase (peroxidase I)